MKFKLLWCKNDQSRNQGYKLDALSMIYITTIRNNLWVLKIKNSFCYLRRVPFCLPFFESFFSYFLFFIVQSFNQRWHKSNVFTKNYQQKVQVIFVHKVVSISRLALHSNLIEQAKCSGSALKFPLVLSPWQVVLDVGRVELLKPVMYFSYFYHTLWLAGREEIFRICLHWVVSES